MARYRTESGVRYIEGDSGYGWTRYPDTNAWTSVRGDVRYTLEKRRRNPRDQTYDTGWYLYDNRPGGFFGEWCASLVLPAVDAADQMINGSEQGEEKE